MKLRDLLEQLTLELNMPKPEDAYDFDNIEVNDMGYGNYYKYTYKNNNPYIKLYYQTDKGLENLKILVKKYGLDIITLSAEELDNKKIEYYLKINGPEESIDSLLKNHINVFDKFNPKGSIEIESGDKMEVTNLVQPPTVSSTTGKVSQPGKVIYIAFGLYEKKDSESEEDEDRKYKAMTGAGDTIKVLATVVEATKQTMKKEGGEDKIYGIAFAPSDNKRKDIYDYYLKALFPKFKKDEEASGGFALFVNQDFKGKEVNEIGREDEKMAPYRFRTEEDGDEYRVYSFKTPSGLNYVVELQEYYPVDGPMDVSNIILYGDDLDDNIPDDKKRRLNDTVLIINFSVEENQNVVTNKGELYRVMNTVSAIIKEDMAINQYIKYIAFNPSKRTTSNPKTKKVRDTNISTNSRANLYTKYILGRIPNAKIIPNNMFDVLAKVK